MQGNGDKLQVRRGLIIGRKKVLRVFKRGPFTYVDTECQCSALTRTYATPLGMLKRGEGLSCQICYQEELQASIQEAIKAARRRVWDARKVLAEAVRRQFEEGE